MTWIFSQVRFWGLHVNWYHPSSFHSAIHQQVGFMQHEIRSLISTYQTIIMIYAWCHHDGHFAHGLFSTLGATPFPSRGVSRSFPPWIIRSKHWRRFAPIWSPVLKPRTSLCTESPFSDGPMDPMVATVICRNLSILRPLKWEQR